MENAKFKEIKTQRLHLRKLRRRDAAQFFRFTGSEAVTKYMLWKPHRGLPESVSSIEKTLSRYETGDCLRWGIALQENGELIGIIDLLGFNEVENTCSFAYMIAEEFWGRGFGTEALTAALEFAFGELKVAAVKADHFAENTASGAVMRKVGMTYCGVLPGKYEKNGIIYDAIQYRITRKEWESSVS